jgi:hypothetical protein
MEWEVEEVVDAKIDRRRLDPHTGKKGCLMYKAKFVRDDTGWNDNPKWQLCRELANAADAVAVFHDRYQVKPGPDELFQRPADTDADAEVGIDEDGMPQD